MSEIIISLYYGTYVYTLVYQRIKFEDKSKKKIYKRYYINIII